MARRAHLWGQLEPSVMNGIDGYRVKFSFGVFSIMPRMDRDRRYWYATKRSNGTLHKVYVGADGNITTEAIKIACLAVLAKLRGHSDRLYGRDHIGHS